MTLAERRSIAERLSEDLKQAMRDKDELARDTLRMLKADIDRRELETGKTLDEAGVTYVLARAVKTRKESVEQYRQMLKAR